MAYLIVYAFRVYEFGQKNAQTRKLIKPANVLAIFPKNLVDAFKTEGTIRKLRVLLGCGRLFSSPFHPFGLCLSDVGAQRILQLWRRKPGPLLSEQNG